MSESRELLATLRDIAEPPAPVGSPPLLIVANVVLALLIVGIVVRRARRRRRAWLTESLAGIERARHLPPAAARLAFAGVLRRVMRHRHGGQSDALHGERWLVRLDEEFGDDWFTRGEGRAFGDALYALPAPAPEVSGGTAGEPACHPIGGAVDEPSAAAESGACDTDRLGQALARRLKRLPRARAARRRSADGSPVTAATARGAVSTGARRP